MNDHNGTQKTFSDNNKEIFDFYQIVDYFFNKIMVIGLLKTQTSLFNCCQKTIMIL